MYKKIAGIFMIAVLMVACDPTVECTKRVGKANTTYLVTLVDSNNTFAGTTTVSSDGSSEVSIDKPCSSIGAVTEANTK